MEPEKSNSDLFPQGLRIDDTARYHIAGIAQWAMIVVVTAVSGYVISLVEVFRGGGVTNRSTSEGFTDYLTVTSTSVAWSIFAVMVGLLINYFLYQFAVQSKKSLATLNPEQLAASFRNLKIYFILVSVILIIVFLFALVAGMTLA